ncbi:MAG: selenium-dependent molybdenum cofactor biosynthesis protein YqeB [Bacillota bacterium]
MAGSAEGSERRRWEPPIILIKGAGDLATGAAHRLFRAGFDVIMTELPEPRAVRRGVAFSECVFRGSVTIEGVTAVRVGSLEERAEGTIPVLVDPDGRAAAAAGAPVLVDARMAKRNLGTRIDDAPVVVTLGPGFTAGVDAHAVVETARGHYLGQVIYRGRAQEFTGLPGEVGGFTAERVLRAPSQGELKAVVELAAWVDAGQAVAEVAAGAERLPIKASVTGVVRGLLRDGAPVFEGQKVGDVDPRCDPEAVWRISDKARAVGGGVMEAIMCLLWGRPPAEQAAGRVDGTTGAGSK